MGFFEDLHELQSIDKIEVQFESYNKIIDLIQVQFLRDRKICKNCKEHIDGQFEKVKEVISEHRTKQLNKHNGR